MKYVSLHTHTTYSYGDGYGPPAAHVARVSELGMGAVAFTEHGNVSSHVQLAKAAEKNGVQPIFGLEAYTAPANMRETQNQRKWHLTLLASTQEGYHNLNKIVTRSYDEGFYKWPTVTGQMLKEHNDGLIILSGCADSQLACTLLGGKGIPDRTKDPHYKEAVDVVRRYQRLLGDRYFLEVQQFPKLRRTCTLNHIYEQISRDTGVPLCATSDVHYPHPSDNEIQKILHAASRNTGTVAAAEAEWEYGIRLTYPRSDNRIFNNLVRTGLSRRSAQDAIAATAEIAKACKVILPTAERLRFPCPDGTSSRELIWDWLRKGWKFRARRNPRLNANKRVYIQQLRYEMDLIERKDFVDYFLMLSDLVSYAKDAGIAVGPARGSAAASLTCYLLRITEVDPLQFPTMVFERFIDESREDLPDVDLDFASNRRFEVFERAQWRYGRDRVANIATYTRYRGKNAIDDVARVYRIPKFEAETIKGLVIERSGGDSRFDASLADTRDMFPQAKAIFDKYPEFENAIRLEGNIKGFGIHAAGLVVANTPITDFCALYTREVNKVKHDALAYDKYDVEHLGLLKLDALGLKTMQMIQDACEDVGMKLDDLYSVALDDPKTLAAFKRGDLTGIFQFSGRATRLVNGDVSPDNFMELADINALSRPGPLFSGATAAYVDVKHGRSEPISLHPIVDRITSWSKGQIIYQEQILQIVREVGDFPWTHAAAIRKIISQKKGEAAFHANWENFRDGANRVHGIDEKLADQIWRFMITSASYAFNVAHCVSYSMLAFWQQWQKQHHPTAFYSSVLANTSTGSPAQRFKVQKIMMDAERHGIRIRPPSLARSGATWRTAGSRTVAAGFTQVPGIGARTAEEVIAYRDAHHPKRWEELIAIKGIGPKTIEKIEWFANHDDPFGLQQVTKKLTVIRKMIEENGNLPKPTHRSGDIPPDANNLRVVWVGIPHEKEYKDFVEDERARTGKEPADILRSMKDPHLVTSCVVRCYDDGDEEVYLRFNRWNFPKYKRVLESLRPEKDIVIAVGIKRKGFGVNLQMRNLYVIDPE